MKPSRKAVVACALALGLGATTFARGASPAEGTIGAPRDDRPGVKATLSYTGSPLAGADPSAVAGARVCEVSGERSTPLCDSFVLHLNLPADYWSRRAGKVTGYLRIDVDGSGEPTSQDSDIDLYVVDEGGRVVASSTSPTVVEAATLRQPLGGTYRIRVVVYQGAVQRYRATVRFVLEKSVPPVVLPSTVRFSPATVVDPTLFAAEPGVNGDQSRPATWFVDGPISVDSGSGMYWRSTDGGATFRLLADPLCPQRRQPGCATAAGGDTEVALSKRGAMYLSTQEDLANMSACTSFDAGDTFPVERCHAITAADTFTDRQWLAVYDDLTAYLASATLTGISLATTHDGGGSWSDARPVLEEVAGGSVSPIAVDSTGGPNDGTLYIPTGRSTTTMQVSRDGGRTFVSYPNSAEPRTGPWFVRSLFITWMTIDRAGNLYLVWPDAATNAVYITTMKASDPRNRGSRVGSTWSAPVRISDAPARSTIFAQIVAGDPGKVAVAYEGADINVQSSVAPPGTSWKIYAGFSSNALCQWDRSCRSGRPTFRQGLVSEKVNHLNDICTSGVGCSLGGNRRLLDFFDLGIDREGRVGVSWADTVNGLGGPTVMFATVLDGPSLYGRRSFRAAAAAGSVKDRTADARAAAGGSNIAGGDFVSSALASSKADVKVTMRLASGDFGGVMRAAGSRHVKYVTRWSYGNDIYFVAADSDGTTTTFYGGKIDANDTLAAPGRTRGYGMIYAKDFDVQGRVTGGTIEITVPRSAVGNPKDGARLFSVQSFAITGLDDVATAHATAPQTLDATPPYDVRVGAVRPAGRPR